MASEETIERPPTTTSPTANGPRRGRSAPTPRLLLVDDRKDSLRALQVVLEPLGLELLSASSGREALRLLLHSEVTAIVLDVQMPGMDGFETAELLRQRAATRFIPIIFLTAIGDNVAHQLRSYELGGFDYISKPFDPKILQAKVRAIVEWSGRLSELAGLRALYEESGVALSAAGTMLDEEGREDSTAQEYAQAVASRRLLDLELEMGVDAARRARAALRSAAEGRLGDSEDTVVLLLSEFVANAVLHAQSNVAVRVDLGGGWVRVEVEDHHVGLPTLSPQSDDGERGRGLQLVGRLANRHGWTQLEGGKIVWFETAFSEPLVGG